MSRTDPHDLLWTEKYRPDSLERLALSEENEKLARSFLKEGGFPHLLLAGQAGTGKTTLAQILIDGVDAQALSLNASDERGIDTIRNKVGSFVRGRLGARWNVVFLDEADNLTRDAQQALRAMMEKHSGNARFILTANYPHRIIDPIRSRCTALEMSEVPAKRRFKILAHILKSEGVKVPSKKVVVSYARKYRDLRRMISSAQRSVQTHEELRPASEALVSGEKIFEACRRNDWSYIKKVSEKTGFDHRAALEDLFSAIPDGFRRAATWRAVVGEAVDDSNRVPDPVVHFLSTCATLIADVHE